MEEFKYLLFLSLCGGYCALIIILRFQLALTGIRPLGSIKARIREIPTSEKLLLLFLSFVILSALHSVYNGVFVGAFRREGILTIAIYVMSCIFLSKYFHPQKWMLWLLGISTCLFCTLSLVQLSGANPFFLYPDGYNYYSAGTYYPGEYLGTIGNTNFCAAFLSVVIGIYAMSFIKINHREKWFLLLPLALALFLLFEIKVDAGLLALIVGLLIMLPVAITDKTCLNNMLVVLIVVVSAIMLSDAVVFADGSVMFGIVRPIFFVSLPVLSTVVIITMKTTIKIPVSAVRIGLLIAVPSIMCLTLLYLWFYNGTRTGIIYEASEVLHGRFDDSFGTSRLYIWRNVLNSVKNNLLLGTGPDTLGYWDIKPFSRYSDTLGMMVTTKIDVAHNEYLQILACTGILSLVCYLVMLICLVVKWYRLPDNKISAISGAGVLFYCVQAFFGISTCITAPFYWTVLAVLIYSQNAYKNQKQ